MQPNHTPSTPTLPLRSKLTLKGLAPDENHYWYNHVLDRRAPRCRYRTKEQALAEAARLRSLGLIVKTFEARIVGEP
jgi:hypothetical protein